MSNLPKYTITIDEEYSDGEDLGWTKTAFTNRPAIRIKGMAFSADIKHEEMFFADKLKYRIAAPAMIPSTIYRNQDGEEFYVEFTEKEIEKIHSKFMKNFGKNKDLFNLEHDSEEMVPAYMLECWLVENPEKDKSFSTYGIKVPKGSLFIVAQITDKEYYHQLVENGQTGFSIEGFLGLSLSMSEETSNEEINNNNNKETKMEKEMILPEGTKFQIEDKWYIVENGVIVEYKEEKTEEVEMAEEKVEETEEVEMAEEKVEEEMMQEEVTEEVVTEEAPVETYTKAEVDAKFEELYKMIADMQAEKVEEVEEEKTEEVMMSAHQRFAEFLRFAKK
jgi:hypothetical protein